MHTDKAIAKDFTVSKTVQDTVVSALREMYQFCSSRGEEFKVSVTVSWSPDGEECIYAIQEQDLGCQTPDGAADAIKLITEYGFDVVPR